LDFQSAFQGAGFAEGRVGAHHAGEMEVADMDRSVEHGGEARALSDHGAEGIGIEIEGGGAVEIGV
jgi:hypothetical protein